MLYRHSRPGVPPWCLGRSSKSKSKATAGWPGHRGTGAGPGGPGVCAGGPNWGFTWKPCIRWKFRTSHACFVSTRCKVSTVCGLSTLAAACGGLTRSLRLTRTTSRQRSA